MQAIKSARSRRAWPLHLRFYLAGWLVLFCGLLSAALIYYFAAQHPDPALGYGMDDGKQYDFQVERLGGKATLFAVQFNQWLVSLWQGTQLAFTIALLAILLAMLCFFVSGHVARDEARRSEGNPH